MYDEQMSEEQLREYEALPKPASCRLIDFDRAQFFFDEV